MDLTRIVYYSERNPPLGMDLKDLLETCHRNNSRDEITGYLHYNGFYFLQVLEGGRDVVSACYHRIVADPRHKNIVLIGAEYLAERAFPVWQMELQAGMENPSKEKFLHYFAASTVDPDLIQPPVPGQ